MRKALCLLSFLSVLFSVSGVEIDWEWRNPLPQGNDLNGICQGADGTVVSVGAAGTILYSDDEGESWSLAFSGTMQDLQGVAYGNGLYVAVGNYRTWLVSSDGIGWSSVEQTSFNSTETLNRIRFLENQFWVTTSSGRIFSSSDGYSVTPRLGSGSALYDITYGAGQYAAVGASGRLVVSSDGNMWTEKEGLPANELYSIHYAAERFFIGGSRVLRYSSDFEFWDGLGTLSDVQGFAEDGAGKVLIFGNSDVVTWENGSWDLDTNSQIGQLNQCVNLISGKMLAVGSGGIIFQRIQAGGAVWNWSGIPKDLSLKSVVVGDSGSVAVGDGAILHSVDGESWVTIQRPTESLTGVTTGVNDYVAVGNSGTILHSTDGQSWSAQSSGTTQNLTGVTSGVSGYVAVGSSGTILHSADGQSWSAQSSGTTQYLHGVTSGSSGYVAVGSYGTILHSSNGQNWSALSSGMTGNLFGVNSMAGGYLAVGYGGAILYSADGQSWSAQNSGTTSTLYGIATGLSGFVVAGSGGTILHSLDGQSWGTGNSGLTQNFYGVTSLAGGYLAVGYGGAILFSADGQSWSERGSVTRLNVNGVTSGQSGYVAVGDSGTILHSLDGQSWSENSSATTHTLRGVTSGVSGYVAVGDSGTILHSLDGQSWITRFSGRTSYYYGVCYGANGYVAVGSGGAISYSEDGQTWSTQSSGTWQTLNGVAYGASGYVAVGNSGIILYSVDGQNWSVQSSGTLHTLYGVTGGESGYLAVGYDGTILDSVDGQNWSVQSSSTTQPLYGVAIGDAGFVAVGYYNTILYSSDAQNWIRQTSGTYTDINAVVFGANGFVTVGDAGRIRFSTDGPNWVSKRSGTTRNLNGVTSGVSGAVAVGDSGTILHSSNGQIWNLQSSGTAWYLNGVIDGASGYVAVGGYGTIRHSVDGQIWSVQSSGTTRSLNGVAFEANGYVAVGDYGTILHSSDGQSWTAQSSGTTRTLVGVTEGANGYVAVGTYGTILHSSDGQSWSVQNSGSTRSLYGVTSGASGYVATGYFGTILYSSDGQIWSAQSSGTIQSLNGVTSGASGYVAVGSSGTLLHSVDGQSWSAQSSGTSQDLNHVTSGVSGYLTAGDNGTILEGVLRPEAPQSVDLGNVTVSEAVGTALVTVSLDRGSASYETTVDYTTQDATAIAGTDYTSVSGTLTFPARGEGEPAVATETISVPIADNGVYNGDRSFLIRLSNPQPNDSTETTGLPVGLVRLMTVTIQEDDYVNAAEFAFAQGTTSVAEGAGSVQVEVRRLGGAAEAVTVDYLAERGESDSAYAGSDFVGVAGQLSWEAGDTSSRWIEVPLRDDSVEEGTETFSVRLLQPRGNAVLGNPSVTRVDILDDDLRTTFTGFTTGFVKVVEDYPGGILELEVVRQSDEAISQAITVTYETQLSYYNPDATSGSDFVATSGTLQWAAGESGPRTIQINLIDDLTVESTEWLSVRLTPVTGPSPERSHMHIRLEDDDRLDQPGEIFIGNLPSQVSETSGWLSVPVSRLSGAMGGVSVRLTAVGAGASEGVDFQALDTTLTFAEGATTVYATLQILDDEEIEGVEGISLNLSNPTGGATLVAPSSASLSIVSEDTTPGLSGTVWNDRNGSGIREAGLVSGIQPDLVLVFDISPSSLEYFYDYLGIGDLNDDGYQNTFLDYQIEAALQYLQTLSEQGWDNGLSVGLVAFAESGVAVNLDVLQAADLPMASPSFVGALPIWSDANGNEVSDLEERIRSITAGAWGAGTGSRFSAGLETAADLFERIGSNADRQLLFFAHDNDNSDDPSTALDRLNTLGVTRQAFGGWTNHTTLAEVQVVDPQAEVYSNGAAFIRAVTSGRGDYAESGLEGWTVYLDADNDFQLDVGEATSVTDTAGNFSFTGLVAGNQYRVSVAAPAGWNATVPIDGSFVLVHPGNTVVDDLMFGYQADGISIGEAVYTVNEGDTSLEITLTRPENSTEASTVDLATVEGTALAGVDFTPLEEAISFGVGEFSKTVTLTFPGDSTIDGIESFIVSLRYPVGSPSGFRQRATVQIIDAELPESPGGIGFAQAQSTVSEGDGTVSVVVNRYNGTLADVTVDYSVTAGDAEAGSDYTLASGSLTFAQDAVSASIEIDILEDSTFELSESLTISLANPSDGAILVNPSQFALTILDNDTALPGTIAFASDAYTVAETAGQVILTLERTGGSDGEVTVTYQTLALEALAGEDYSNVTGSIVFAHGQTSGQVVFPIINDSLYETDERFEVSVDSVSGGAALGTPGLSTVTIQSEDLPSPGNLRFVLSSQQVGEADEHLALDILRTGGDFGTVSATLNTVDGTAVGGVHMGIINESVSLGDGVTSLRVNVPIIDNVQDEANRTFSLTLSTPVGGGLAIPSSQTVTILDDDDAGSVQLLADGYSVNENGVEASINVLRTVSADGEITVDYTTSDGTAVAGTHYTESSGTLTFIDGESVAAITIPITDNVLDEVNKSFSVTLSNPTGGVRLGSVVQAPVTILDDDDAGEVNFVVEEVFVNESAGNAELTIRRGVEKDGPVTVQWTTVAGTAPETLYTPSSGTLSFAHLEGEKTISIPLIDNSQEAGDRNFYVRLESPTGGLRLGVGAEAQVTILEDDEAGKIRFVSTIYEEFEAGFGEGGYARILVERIEGSDGIVSIDWSTVSGGTAKAGTTSADGSLYEEASGTLQLAHGVSSGYFEVPLIDNVQDEVDDSPYRTVNLQLSSPSGGLGLSEPLEAVLRIRDDDEAGDVEFLSADFDELEDNGTATVTIRRVNGEDGIVSVDYRTIAGTAESPAHFTETSGTLTMVHQQTTATFTVELIANVQDEPSRFLEVELLGPLSGGLEWGTQLKSALTITDDDEAGDLRFTSATYSVVEGDAPGVATITVERVDGMDGIVTFDYASVAGGTAVADYLYTDVSGTLTLQHEETSASFTVPVIGNVQDEADKTVNLELDTLTGGLEAGDPMAAVLTITDDDEAGDLRFTSATYSVVEGDAPGVATITVERVDGMDGIVSFDYASVVGGTALADYLYTDVSGTLTLQHEETSASFTVPVIGNVQDEADKTVNLELDTLTGGLEAGDPMAAVLTITDDDEAGDLRFTSATYSVVEGDAPGVATITVERVDGMDGIVSFDYASVVGGTALADYLYTDVSGTLTLQHEETSTSFTVPVIGNVQDEADKTVNLELSTLTGGLEAGDPMAAVLTITDDDEAGDLRFTSATYSVVEGDGPGVATITVERVDGMDGIVSFDYASVVGGTALADYLYTDVSGTLTLQHEETSASFTVPVIGNVQDEADKTVNLELDTLTGGLEAGDPMAAVLTITDDDEAGDLRFTSATYSVVEGDAPGVATITVERVDGMDGIVSFDYASVVGGTALADYLYTDVSGTLTLQHEETSASFTVPVIGNVQDEADKTVNLELDTLTGGLEAGDPMAAVLTITDDDEAGDLRFTSATYSVVEGDAPGVATITVERVDGMDGIVSFDYASVVGGTALADYLYTDVSGTLTLQHEETSASFTVPVIGNVQDEADKTVNLELDTLTGGLEAGDPMAAVLTITDDDEAGDLRFTSATYSVVEGDAPGVATITVERVDGMDGIVSFDYASVVGGTALADYLYTDVSGTLTLQHEETSTSFTVPVIGNVQDEADKTVNLELSTLTGGLEAGDPMAAVLTITDDDEAGDLRFTSATYSVVEGDGPGVATITVERVDGMDGIVSFDYASVVGGTALADYLYTDVSGTLTLQHEETSASFTVPVIGNVQDEADKTVNLELDTLTGGLEAGDPMAAVLTITDDDEAGDLRFTSATYSVIEGDGPGVATITVERVDGMDGIVSFDYASVVGGTAQSPKDYLPVSGSHTFAHDESSFSFDVQFYGNFSDDGDKSIFLALSNLTGALEAGLHMESQLTILDDDSSFDEFAHDLFSDSGISDPELTGFEADADGDGVSNGLEFFLGRNILKSAREADNPFIIREVDGHWTIEINFRPGSPEHAIDAEISENLRDWTPLLLGFSNGIWSCLHPDWEIIQQENLSEDLWRISLRSISDEGLKYYLRARATENP